MSRTMNLLAAGFVVSAVLMSHSLATAATITFQGTALTDDNSLLQGFSADDNRGGLSVPDGPGGNTNDKRRVILRFDLSSLAGEKITSASLQITKGGGSGTFTNATVNIHKIFGTNAGWIEGTDTDLNVGVDTGSSTWSGAVHGSVNWVDSVGAGNFPGLGNPGDGYEATPLASFLVNSSDPNDTTVKNFNFADVSFVQDWVDNPGENAGFIFTAPTLSGTWRFYNSEVANPAFQPILTVTTAPPIPEPATGMLLGLGLLGISVRRRRQAKELLLQRQ